MGKKLKDILATAALRSDKVKGDPMKEHYGTQRISDEIVKKMRDKIELLEKLDKYNRAQDVFSDYSLEAAKSLVLEAKHGEKSSDRIRAAEGVLGYDLGKPMQRQVNLNMSVSDKSDKEIDSEIQTLMSELGMVKAKSKGILLESDDEQREKTERDVTPETSGEKGTSGHNKA